MQAPSRDYCDMDYLLIWIRRKIHHAVWKGRYPSKLLIMNRDDSCEIPIEIPEEIIAALAEQGKPESGDDLPAAHIVDKASPPRNTPCSRDILAMLEEVEQRMTAGQVLGWMTAKEKPYSESTITKTLVYMSQKSHELSTNEDHYGKGYGLAEWQ